MTPKEKANKLVEKYFSTISGYQDAKQCALIAVDEILDIDCCDMSEENFDKHIEYWQEVKKEIEAL